MALLGYEHFDLYGTDFGALALRGWVGGIGVVLTSGRSRTGTHSLSMSSSTNVRTLSQTLAAPVSVFGQGCAIYMAEAIGSTASTSNGMRFGTAADANAIRVTLTSGFGFRIYQGTTLLASSDVGLWAVGTWFWLEAKVIAGTGDGSVEVRLNGADTPIMVVTGLTIAQITRFSVGHQGTSASNSNMNVDDYVWWDDTGPDTNDFMGDTFVIVGPPEADTAVADWDASTGTDRFAMIDEATPNDADYIESDAIGEACEFTHPAFNLGVGSIVAIASQTRAFKSDAGAASYATGIVSGGVASMSNEIALATGPNIHAHLSPRNPNGNVPWTQAAANAARLRVERAA